jgi:Na+-driven multidrug efflux pump
MNLLKDEVSLLVRKLAVPASVGTLFQTLYTIVDTFYAGKISPEALSALSKSFPIYFLIIATSIGVTVAGTSLIGSSIGEKNEKNVLSYFGNVIIYSIIISVVVSILGFAFGEKIFLLMNSSQEVTILGLEYINIIFFRYDIIYFISSIKFHFYTQRGNTKNLQKMFQLFSFFS